VAVNGPAVGASDLLQVRDNRRLRRGHSRVAFSVTPVANEVSHESRKAKRQRRRDWDGQLAVRATAIADLERAGLGPAVNREQRVVFGTINHPPGLKSDA